MSVTKRCFVLDLHSRNFVANSSRESVRVIGIILSMQLEASKRFPVVDESVDEKGVTILTLDDGTASVDIWTPTSMAATLCIEEGKTIDCIARLGQKGSLKRWYAEALILVEDSDTEALRWKELCYVPKKNECMRHGYPKKVMNADEAYRLIRLQHEIDASGTRIEELALVMRLGASQIENFLEELQLSGRIYKDEKGLYVPL